MKTKNRNRKVGVKRLSRARRLRQKRKLARATPRLARKKRAPQGVRGDGPPVRNVQGSLAVIMLGESRTVWEKRCCARCTRYHPASMSVTWEFWHRGTWRSTRRYSCDRHGGQLQRRLNEVVA